MLLSVSWSHVCLLHSVMVLRTLPTSSFNTLHNLPRPLHLQPPSFTLSLLLRHVHNRHNNTMCSCKRHVQNRSTLIPAHLRSSSDATLSVMEPMPCRELALLQLERLKPGPLPAPANSRSA